MGAATVQRDPAERVLRLLALLLSERRPFTSAEIFEALPEEYAGSEEARLRKLHRDRQALEELGVPLAREEGEEQGYRIERSAFQLPEVALSSEERAALCAVGSAAVEAAFPLRGELGYALAKLRATLPEAAAGEHTGGMVLAVAPAPTPVAEQVARAVLERRRLVLRYATGEGEREVDPYAFASRRGRFLFVGYCHLRRGIRTFYADRVLECRVAREKEAAPQFTVPEDFSAAEHLPDHPWQVKKHDPVEVELAFSPALAETAPRLLGIAPGTRCVTTHLDGLIAQVLALGPGVEIRAPAEARARVRARLAPLQRALERR